MKFRFKKGDECFIASRYDGILRVRIQKQIEYENEPCYELDRLVQVHKDGNCVGSAEYEFIEGEYYHPDSIHQPCPETMLFVVGDKCRNAMSNFFGGTADDIFTQQMADDII